ncbi:MAG: hypothetical protein HY014_09010 [Acidobacteria bacterium]|nr:hypothetical protein [Acidobacteriota bacterium]MBI3488293.1 hypothetical protein [Acidobacteriota bacterium]
MTALPSLALAALLVSGLPGQAQTRPAPQAAPQTSHQPAPAQDPDPDPAVLKAMKSRVFEVVHRSPYRLVNSLRALCSGVRGSRIDPEDSDGIRTISVRDFPENLALIEAALKQVDGPPAVAAAQEVELHVQVLFASRHPAPEGSLPEELQSVVKSLKGALSYRGYTLAATFVQRWDLSHGLAIQGTGQVDGAPFGFGTLKDPSQLRIDWEAAPARGFEPKLDAASTLQIPKFQLSLDERTRAGGIGLAKIETSVNLKEGEHVVVGTSVVRDQGLITVVTARRLK